MSAKKVEIKELRLRVSGLTRAQGRRLGELVAKRLAEVSRSPIERKSVGEISIKLRGVSNGSVDHLAGEVATQVKRRLS